MGMVCHGMPATHRAPHPAGRRNYDDWVCRCGTAPPARWRLAERAAGGLPLAVQCKDWIAGTLH